MSQAEIQPPLRQTWPEPTVKREIVILAGGDIVRDAHIPAYNKSGYRVRGVYDIDPQRARARAREAGGAAVYASMAEATAAGTEVIYDIASPPTVHAELLAQLPEGAAVAVQKPMGQDLAAARHIVAICRERRLKACVNFQLRFSPQMLAVRDYIERGLMGEIVDIEVRLNLLTPWDLFPFLKTMKRVEILVHSVHYLDLIRSFTGNPQGVYARTVGHPRHPELAQTKTSAILDYGDRMRCCLSINHGHGFGERHEEASIQIEGAKGCAVVRLGWLLNYPKGKPETLAVFHEGGWRDVPLVGTWFPDGFIGVMANLQRYAAGEDERLITSVEDAFHTMALVEACYESSAMGGVAPAVE